MTAYLAILGLMVLVWAVSKYRSPKRQPNTALTHYEDRPYGLTYKRNVVDKNRRKEFLKWIATQRQHMEMAVHKKVHEETTDLNQIRQVLQFGYKYNYQSGQVNDLKDPSLPPVLNCLRKIASDMADVDYNYFNQCIVNRYLTGQGIAPHIDHGDFENVIACITIIDPMDKKVPILFGFRDEMNTKFALETHDSSVYIMQNQARWICTHEQPKIQPSDRIIVRYSITFRRVYRPKRNKQFVHV